MNWIFVCLFNLLLFISCLSANIYEGTSRSDNQQQNQSARNGTYLNLGYIEKHTFTNLTRPFPNVKKLHLNIRTNQNGSALPIDELFPNLEILQINYWDSPNKSENNGNRFIERELPAIEHLKYLSIYALVENEADIATIQKQLGNMLSKNSQIKTLSYDGHVLNDFVQEINEHLPNLEDFTVYNLHPKIRPVHFENVKHFKLNAWAPCPAENISFSHLEFLKMSYLPRIRDSWLKFFRDHQNLRQLDCLATEEEGLAELLADLSDLQEIRISSWDAFHTNLVSRLIENHENVVKFHYNASPKNSTVHLDMDAFLQKFENEWNISFSLEGRRPFIELERKN